MTYMQSRIIQSLSSQHETSVGVVYSCWKTAVNWLMDTLTQEPIIKKYIKEIK